MSKQIVNTEGIEETVSCLVSVNNAIINKIEELQYHFKEVENTWRSRAGERACTMMYQIFKNSEYRSAVIQNYINLLEQQVNPGYVNKETENTTLADMFK